MAGTPDAKELIPRLFEEVVNQGREEAIDEYFDPDFTDHGPGVDLHSREEFRAVIKAWRSSFTDLRCEVSNVIQEGELAAWLVRTTGVHTGDGLGFPATGKRIDTLSANIGRIRNGKAVEHWSEQGMLQMLQQVGVVPHMAPPQPVG
jgi:predicted ester cyclase